MGKVLFTFSDRSYLEYDKGRFDEFCLYYVEDGEKKPPTDVNYFQILVRLTSDFPPNRIYADYISVYDLTGKQLEESVFKFIEQVAKKYVSTELLVQKLFSILYATMVAEENKSFTRLGKRVKRLGIHQILIEKMPVIIAANYSKGKTWREIDTECKKRGF